MPDLLDLSQMESVPVNGPLGFQRLNRYWREPTGDLWDDVWVNTPKEQYWEGALRGELSADYSRLFTKYLKDGGRLLEAGCGVGQVVLAMNARGYECHGLDFAEGVISMLNGKFPEVPFICGDIRDIPNEDDFFDGYISLGVIEHFEDGQDQMISEASRVLKKGGHMFLSVPFLNKYRKSKISKLKYDKQPSLPFFEACYSVDELRYLCEKNGFELVEQSYQNSVMTFAQESFIRPLYRLIEDTRFPRNVIDRFLQLVLPGAWFGHMVMVVAKKL